MAKTDDKEFERARLLKAVAELGFPLEFGEIIADELGGAWSLRRMTGYLKNAQPNTMELIADEMLAILEERRRIADQAQTESANAGWNEFLNR